MPAGNTSSNKNSYIVNNSSITLNNKLLRKKGVNTPLNLNYNFNTDYTNNNSYPTLNRDIGLSLGLNYRIGSPMLLSGLSLSIYDNPLQFFSYEPKLLSNYQYPSYGLLTLGSLAGTAFGAGMNYGLTTLLSNTSSNIGNNIGNSIKGPSLYSTPELFFLSSGSSTVGNNAAGSSGNAAASTAKNAAKNAMWGALAQAGEIPFTVDGRYYKRGTYDAFDPFYHIGDVTFSDGNKGHIESGAGNFFSDAGVKTFQTGAGMGNGWVMLAGAGLKSIGDIINNGWGMAVNDKALNRVNSDIASLNNYYSNVDNFDDIRRAPSIAGAGDVYKGGVFRTGEANEKNKFILNKLLSAIDFSDRSYMNNIFNIERDLLNYAKSANSVANGGQIEIVDYSTPIGYESLINDYVEKQNRHSNSMPNLFAGTSSTMFATGGIKPNMLQTNGAEFSNGVTHINSGDSHEENPNGGVLMGVDYNNTPNLVEEGEVVYNDYVFSNRLTVPDYKKQYKNKKEAPYEALVLWNYSNNTFADAAKKTEKNTGADERPTDTIALEGMESTLEILASVQEKEREKEKLEKMKQAIDNMSPEELAALLQQLELLQQQEQLLIAQLAMLLPVMQEQVIPPTQEDIALAQQQAMSPVQAALPIMLPVAAYGGKIFDYGGPLHGKVNISNDEENERTIKRALKKAGYYKEYDKYIKQEENKGKSYKDFALDINNTIDKNDTKEYLKTLDSNTKRLLARKYNINLTLTGSEDSDEVIGKIAQKIKTPSAAYKEVNSIYNPYILDRASGSIPEYAKIKKNTRSEWGDFPADYIKDIKGESDDKYRLAEGNTYFGDKTATDVEAQNNYKDYTNYVLGLDPVTNKGELSKILKWYDNHRPDNISSRFYTNDDILREDWQDTFRTIRQGDLGAGHVTPIRNDITDRNGIRYMLDGLEIDASNYLDENGKWINPVFTIDEGTPTNENGINYITYNLTRNDNTKSTPRYYVDSNGNAVDASNGEIIKNNNSSFPEPANWPYYAGLGLYGASFLHNLLSPADYSNADALIEASLKAGKYNPVAFNPIGTYLTYRPDDPRFITADLIAASNGTYRKLANTSGGNPATLRASLLANSNNTYNAIGKATRQGLEHNDDKYYRYTNANNELSKYWSKGFLDADIANQRAALDASRTGLAGLLAGYAMKDNIDARKQEGINASLNGLVNLAMVYGQNKWNKDLTKWRLEHNQYPIAAKGGKILKKKSKGLGF